MKCKEMEYNVNCRTRFFIDLTRDLVQKMRFVMVVYTNNDKHQDGKDNRAQKIRYKKMIISSRKIRNNECLCLFIG